MSDNICDSVNTQSNTESTLTSLTIDALKTDPSEVGQVFEMMQPQIQVELPGVDLFENAPGFNQKMQTCLSENYRIGDQRQSFEKIADLNKCDERFQVLVKDMARTCSMTPEGRAKRASLAKQIIDFTQKDAQAKELMTPFMEHLYEEAYAFYVPPKR